jgi:hypothetical protein
MRLKWNATLPTSPGAAPAERAGRCHRPGGVVRRGLDQQRDAVRRVRLVDRLVVIGGIAAAGALDRGLDLVLGHVDRAGVLDDAAQGRIRARIGAAGLHGHRDVLGDARELLGHAVPAREHRVLANLENASHGVAVRYGAAGVGGRP